MSKRIYRSLLALILVVLGSVAYGQTETTGFYVILDRGKDCSNPFKSLSAWSPMCLSKSPIIPGEDFEDVSTIATDSVNAKKSVQLKISKQAYGKFQLMAKKLPRTKLVLVVDGTIVGVLENIDNVGNPIPIYSTLYSSEVEWVYQKLKKVRPADKL